MASFAMLHSRAVQLCRDGCCWRLAALLLGAGFSFAFACCRTVPVPHHAEEPNHRQISLSSDSMQKIWRGLDIV